MRCLFDFPPRTSIPCYPGPGFPAVCMMSCRHRFCGVPVLLLVDLIWSIRCAMFVANVFLRTSSFLTLSLELILNMALSIAICIALSSCTLLNLEYMTLSRLYVATGRTHASYPYVARGEHIHTGHIQQQYKTCLHECHYTAPTASVKVIATIA